MEGWRLIVRLGGGRGRRVGERDIRIERRKRMVSWVIGREAVGCWMLVSKEEVVIRKEKGGG